MAASPRRTPEPFPSSQRGDVMERFASTNSRPGSVAGLVSMSDKSAVRVNRHAFEQQKQRENEAISAAQESGRKSKSHAAAAQWQAAREQEREREERGKQQRIAAKRQSRAHTPSAANPLAHPELQQEEAEEEEQQQEEQEEHAQEQLDSNAEESDADEAGAGSEEEGEQQAPRAAAPRAGSPEVTLPGKLHNEASHLAVGSLAPEQLDEESARRLVPGALAAAMAQEMSKLQVAEQKMEELLREYPHGVPKKLLRELRAAGVDAPQLGHGSLASARPADRILYKA